MYLPLSLIAVAFLTSACGKEQAQADGTGTPAAAAPAPDNASQGLTGAGATFPNPIYQKWSASYYDKTKVKINYQSIGSGGGIKQFSEGTVDFGATDGPMTEAQLATVKGQVLHLPTVLGADVVTYNVKAIGTTKLKLDGPTIAGIFLGTITKWNDRAIAATNAGVKLPAQDIIVVHRSDGSGTTYIWTDYLSKVSPEWKQKVGNANSVNWPVGLGGKGNEGVTQQVKQTDGSIGYVELIYAISNNLSYADVKNPAGVFVTPSLASVTAAAASAQFTPDTDFRVSIVNAPGADAYPISSFTWFLVRPDMPDPVKAKALKSFLEWVVTDEAQQQAQALHYSPLPAPVVALVKQRITTLKAQGKPIA
jgi:phosphate transport system substrate-binding protein